MGVIELGVLLFLLAMLFAFGWLEVHWRERGRFIIAGFGLFGALLPIAWALTAGYLRLLAAHLDSAALTLCPPCVLGFLHPTGVGPIIFVVAFVIMTNAILYAFAGTFVRLGMVVRKAFWIVPAAMSAGLIWWYHFLR